MDKQALLINLAGERNALMAQIMPVVQRISFIEGQMKLLEGQVALEIAAKKQAEQGQEADLEDIVA